MMILPDCHYSGRSLPLVCHPLDRSDHLSTDGFHPGNVRKNRTGDIPGTTGTLKRNYPRYILYVMLLFSAPAIVMKHRADMQAWGPLGQPLVSSHSPHILQYFFYTLTLLIGIIYFLTKKKKIASVLKYLCIVLLVALYVWYTS